MASLPQLPNELLLLILDALQDLVGGWQAKPTHVSRFLWPSDSHIAHRIRRRNVVTKDLFSLAKTCKALYPQVLSRLYEYFVVKENEARIYLETSTHRNLIKNILVFEKCPLDAFFLPQCHSLAIRSCDGDLQTLADDTVFAGAGQSPIKHIEIDSFCTPSETSVILALPTALESLYLNVFEINEQCLMQQRASLQTLLLIRRTDRDLSLDFRQLSVLRRLFLFDQDALRYGEDRTASLATLADRCMQAQEKWSASITEESYHHGAGLANVWFGLLQALFLLCERAAHQEESKLFGAGAAERSEQGVRGKWHSFIGHSQHPTIR